MTISKSAAETFEFGRQLADKLQAGDILALTGELGAGKTCFVKGLARGLGVTQAVTSPTFTLIHEYRGGRLPLFHVDLYRLDSVAQALAVGIEDYLNGAGVTVIEWAEKIAPLLPARTIHVRLTATGETTRTIEMPA
jgi:tRNA threonylcarbamoyladenosine biosynthesis protein TsaE